MARPRDYGRGAGNHKIKCSPPGTMCSREIPRVAHCIPRAGNLVFMTAQIIRSWDCYFEVLTASLSSSLSFSLTLTMYGDWFEVQ